MISGKKKRSFNCIMGLTGIPGVLLILLLLSCPNPIDKMLANQVEDNTSPLITITSPDPDVKYYYPSEIEIEGIVVDFVDQAGGIKGAVQSLHYEEQFNKRIQGDIDFNSDGTFAFTIDTLRPEILEGTQYLVITATDWNGNTAEVIFTAYDKTTGPLIGVDIDYNMYTSNPAANVPFTVTGVVGVPTWYLTYDVEPDSGPNIIGVDIPFNGTTGDFSFDFNPAGAVVSGRLKFIIKAEDNDGPSTHIFYLDDDPVPPAFDIGSSAVNGSNSYVDLFFSEGIYHTDGTAPLDADFAITGWNPGSGTVIDITKSGVAGTPAGGATTIRMNIDVTGVPYGDETVTITASSITDEVGNPISPVDITLPLSDNTAPSVVQIRTDAAYEGKAHKSGVAIPIIITFDGPVNWMPLTLDLNTGSTATCSSGGPSSEITLTYTVQDGDNTPAGPPPLPLNYPGISSLHGTVTDEGGNPTVDPVLPPTPNDLAAMNMTIDTIPPTGLNLVINDADGKISKQENKDGVPFTVEGEAFTDYLIELDRCQIENPGSSPPLSGQIPVGESVTGFELETAAGVFDGYVTVTVTLTDAADNESTTSGSLEVATVAPSPPVFITSTHSTQDPSIYWEWDTGGGGGNGYYRWEVNNPNLTAPIGFQQLDYTYDAEFELDGPYTLYVEERNDLDNWSDTASQTITLDRGDPVVTAPASITVAADNANGTPKTSTAIDNFLSGATVTDAIDPSPTLDVTVGDLTPPAIFPVGETTVRFTGTDDAGNTDYVERTVTVEPTVISPDGGETWEAGTQHTVSWSYNDTGNVNIALYKGGVWNSNIVTDTSDDGSYSWTISSGQAAGTDYRVRVTDPSTGAFDESDASFTITRITVNSPDGGESIGAGTSYGITWINGTSNVDIDLYKGGAHHSDIATDISNDGAHTWNIPSTQEAGTDYRVRVTDSSGYDESDAFFTIEKITVTQPNTNVTWAAGTQYNVTWTSSGSGSVKIDLYKGGGSPSEITASTPNTGSFAWTIDSGQTAGTDYRVRVTDLATSVYDESDADFTITN